MLREVIHTGELKDDRRGLYFSTFHLVLLRTKSNKALAKWAFLLKVTYILNSFKVLYKTNPINTQILIEILLSF